MGKIKMKSNPLSPENLFGMKKDQLEKVYELSIGRYTDPCKLIEAPINILKTKPYISPPIDMRGYNEIGFIIKGNIEVVCVELEGSYNSEFKDYFHVGTSYVNTFRRLSTETIPFVRIKITPTKGINTMIEDILFTKTLKIYEF